MLAWLSPPEVARAACADSLERAVDSIIALVHDRRDLQRAEESERLARLARHRVIVGRQRSQWASIYYRRVVLGKRNKEIAAEMGITIGRASYAYVQAVRALYRQERIRERRGQ